MHRVTDATTTIETRADAAGHTTADFHALLVAALPKLRVQAVSLTRNRADADDLVQGAVTSALGAKASFEPGTNFGAWMFRILRNRFISNVRARRATTDIADVPERTFASPGAQEDSLVVGELRKHMARLPADQRAALVMVTLQGLSYEEVAAAMECAVGTAKCRVFRARQMLHRLLMGEERVSTAALVRRVARAGQRGPNTSAHA